MLTDAVANELRTATWPSILPSIIDAAERDSQLANMHAALHRNMMTPFTTAVERAQTRGELTPGRARSEIVAALVGQLFYRRWFSKEPGCTRYFGGMPYRPIQSVARNSSVATVGAPQDKRVERSKAAVLTETYRQLTARGLSGVSVDEVARNSRVAKTTIYRHWPSRSALLIEACSRVGSAQAVPDTGTLRGDLLTLAATVAEQLWTAEWPSVLPSIIDAAERDSDIADMFSALHEANMTPFYAVVQRGIDRGEIRSDGLAGDLVAAVVGPLFYRRWFSKESIDQNFVESVVDAVLDAAGKSKARATTPARARRPSHRSPG